MQVIDKDHVTEEYQKDQLMRPEEEHPQERLSLTPWYGDDYTYSCQEQEQNSSRHRHLY